MILNRHSSVFDVSKSNISETVQNAGQTAVVLILVQADHRSATIIDLIVTLAISAIGELLV